MPTSSTPGPDDRENHGGLSPWEQEVLARIEDDLVTGDPRLARRVSRRPRAGPVWWPMSARATGLLFVVLSVLVLAGSLLPASWWPVLGLVTTVTVVAWLVLAATEENPPGGIVPG